MASLSWSLPREAGGRGAARGRERRGAARGRERPRVRDSSLSNYRSMFHSFGVPDPKSAPQRARGPALWPVPPQAPI
eukprot:4348589-Prymnesium_polylepis.1